MHALTEIKDFDLILQTFKKFAAPLMFMLFTMYTVASIFCTIGMFIFKDAISLTEMATLAATDGPFMYYLENFNDYYSGMITLFCVMIENNWNNTTNNFTDIFGKKARLFFCTYWVCMVLIMWNIVSATIMELYATTSENLSEYYEKRQLALKLMHKFKD